MNKEIVRKNIWWVLTAIGILITYILVVCYITKINNSYIITPELQDKINNFEQINPYLEEKLNSAKKFYIYPFISSLITICLCLKLYIIKNFNLNKKVKV